VGFNSAFKGLTQEWWQQWQWRWICWERQWRCKCCNGYCMCNSNWSAVLVQRQYWEKKTVNVSITLTLWRVRVTTLAPEKQ